MRHFDQLTAPEQQRLFHQRPRSFGAGDDPAVLATGLGATLYSPATRPALAKDIATQRALGVLSVVVCLEDAISDGDVPAAQAHAIAQLRDYAATDPDGPLLFVRVRSPEQIPAIVDGLGDQLPVLTGFVLPKFTERTGAPFLAEVAAASADTGQLLHVMPVLESPEIVHAESRISALLAARDLLAAHRDHVLAIRVGATDLSAAYGLRRSREVSVYDIRVVADAIADVVNVFGRADGSGYVVTGPVWEYFPRTERMFKPQLRESPFARQERPLRAELLARDLDGLIREVVLDRANGLTGKTVIHPSHVAAVHALSVVSHEEYCDALDVLDADGGGGAVASSYRNKMNESKPHLAWAARTALRARLFGVARPEVSFVDLLGAGLQT